MLFCFATSAPLCYYKSSVLFLSFFLFRKECKMPVPVYNHQPVTPGSSPNHGASQSTTPTVLDQPSMENSVEHFAISLSVERTGPNISRVTLSGNQNVPYLDPNVYLGMMELILKSGRVQGSRQWSTR